MNPNKGFADYLNPFSFLKELTIKGDASLFKPDGSLNLDVYIAYNHERLGFPDSKTLRRELELEVRKCLLREEDPTTLDNPKDQKEAIK